MSSKEETMSVLLDLLVCGDKKFQEFFCFFFFFYKFFFCLFVFRFSDNVSCFAFNGDKTKLALCPNNSEIWIYAKNGEEWEEECVLKEHSELVTGLDWGVKTNRIVSCSQDRNA